MARLSPIQEDFSSGIIGQRVRGRVFSDVYKKALAECKNWYPLVQGPVRMREGSEYISQVDADNWSSGQAGSKGIRVFTFQRGLDEDVIIEVGDTDIVAVNSGGDQVIGGVTDNLIPDIWADPTVGQTLAAEWTKDLDKYIYNTDPGRFLRFSQEAGIIGGWFTVADIKGFIMSGETNNAPDGFHGPALETADGFPITIPAGSELLVNEISFEHTSYFLGSSDADPKIRVSIGTTPGASDVHTTDVSLGNAGIATSVTVSFTPGATNNDLYLSIGWVWTGAITTVPLFSSGYGDSGKGIGIFVAKLNWVAPLTGGSGTGVSFTSPYTRAQLDCLQYDMDPGEQVAYFFHPEVETRRLRLDVGEWTFETLSAITVPSSFVAPTPNNWAASNYPAAGAFHEGRLWLAGSPINPATLWASESGDYQNFDNVTPSTKADPLLFPLSSAGKIQTLTSRKELVINTDISEVIGTSDLGVIAFDDFSFPKQTDWGATCVQPVVVGRNMIFTSNSRQRMRTFQDGGDSIGGWDGNELSLLAQELFNSKVRRMVYLDEPAYQACFLLEDGTMAMATYFYPEKVIGWWKYETSHNGDRSSGNETKPGEPNQAENLNQFVNQIMDITKINTSRGAKLWMVVNRTGFTGTTLPNHELLSFDTGRVPALDSFVQRDIDPTTRKISNLDHLTDQSINVVIQRDDPFTGVRSFTVHPNITSIAGLSTELETWTVGEGNIAHVGLFYDNNFKLLPLEGVSNRGTSQVSKRRWNKIYLRLNNSSIPLVNGEYPKDRTPATPMGTGEPIISDDREYSELGSDQGELNVDQDKPLTAEVLAIFGKVISGEV